MNTETQKVDVLAELRRQGVTAKVHDAVAELIAASIEVHASCRAGKEPDLIALADALNGVGAKAERKAALARLSPEVRHG